MCLKGRSSEEESKARVAAIHDLKEKLKSENEELKKIKHKLKDVQEKQKGEKEVNLWKIRAPIRHMFGTSCKLLGSLRKDDGNGNDDTRKPWSDWFNEEK